MGGAHSCDTPYECQDCHNNSCPNGACEACCTHKEHVCERVQANPEQQRRDEEAREQQRRDAAREQQRRDEEAREQQRRDEAAREQQRREEAEEAAREQQRREDAVREQQRRDEAAREQQRREEAAREQQRREEEAALQRRQEADQAEMERLFQNQAPAEDDRVGERREEVQFAQDPAPAHRLDDEGSEDSFEILDEEDFRDESEEVGDGQAGYFDGRFMRRFPESDQEPAVYRFQILNRKVRVANFDLEQLLYLRATYLADLATAKALANVPLTTVSDLLEMLLETRNSGFEILMSENDALSRETDLRRYWLTVFWGQRHADHLCGPVENDVVNDLSTMHWNVEVLKLFLIGIGEHTASVLRFLELIRQHRVGDFEVFDVITECTQEGNTTSYADKLEYRRNYDQLLRVSTRIAQSRVLGPERIRSLIGGSFSFQTLMEFIIANTQAVEGRLDEFGDVVSFLTDHRLANETCRGILTNLLQLEDASTDWMDATMRYAREEEIILQEHAYVPPSEQALVQQLMNRFLPWDNQAEGSFLYSWQRVQLMYSRREDRDTIREHLQANANAVTFAEARDVLEMVSDTRACFDALRTPGDWKEAVRHQWLYHIVAVSVPRTLLHHRTQLAIELRRLNWSVATTRDVLAGVYEARRLDVLLQAFRLARELNLELDQQAVEGRNLEGDILTTLLLRVCCGEDCKWSEGVKLAARRAVTAHAQLVARRLAQFREAMDILHLYQMSETRCDAAIQHLVQADAETGWADIVASYLEERVFGDSRTLSEEEVIDSMALTSPGLTVEDLRRHLDEVDAVSARTSQVEGLSESTANEIIGRWTKAQVDEWCRKRGEGGTQEVTAVVQRAMSLRLRGPLHIPQRLALVALLASSKRLAEVATGQGKSAIVAMLAADHALRGSKVDVLTTNEDLSKREVRKQKKFFQSLGLTVGNCCDGNYDCDVIYGTMMNFSGDILQARRQGRPFDVLLVDEADSAMFDERTHQVRLADRDCGMLQLNLLLTAIFERVLRLNALMTQIDGATYFLPEEFTRNGRVITLRSGRIWTPDGGLLVPDRYNFIREHTTNYVLNTLLRTLNKTEQEESDAYREAQFNILRLQERIEDAAQEAATQLEQLQRMRAELTEMERNLTAMPWTRKIETEPVLEIPKHLRDYARTQVEFYVSHAYEAEFVYRKDMHYAVKKGRIVPINFAENGVWEENMVWSRGLTQFLQIKEKLHVDPMGEAKTFLSSVGLIRRYMHLLGVTGTIGSQSTQAFFQDVFGADSVFVPRYSVRTVMDNEQASCSSKELLPRVFTCKDTWRTEVVRQAIYHAGRGRAVLVILKSVKLARRMRRLIAEAAGNLQADIRTYVESGTDVNPDVGPGCILLATNLAGRGTDLAPSEAVERAGGLVVLVTFMPLSERVGDQNNGRTGRKDNKGMVQLLVYDNRGRSIDEMKLERLLRSIEATQSAILEADRIALQDKLYEHYQALESSLLPSLEDCARMRMWTRLRDEWPAYWAQEQPRALRLVGEFLAAKRNQFEAEGETENNINARIEALREPRMIIAKENCLNRFLGGFERQVDRRVPSDLKACLQQEQEFRPQQLALAAQNDWGEFERKALLERWGLWLANTRTNNREDPIQLFNSGFRAEVLVDAERDCLILNPHIFVLKGNHYLEQRCYQKAIACYQRAIDLDKDFSAFARYNKAYALLKQNRNNAEYLLEAEEELTKVSMLVQLSYKNSLMMMHVMTSRAAKGSAVDAPSETANGLSCLMNVMSQLCCFVESALKEISSARRVNKNVTVQAVPLADSFSACSLNHHRAIAAVKDDGLITFFSLQGVEPKPWLSIIGLAALGLGQVAWGVVTSVFTAGAFGSVLIFEGVMDVLFAVRGYFEGRIDWKAWMVGKAISVSLAFATCGLSSVGAVVNAAKSVGTVSVEIGLKIAACRIKDALITGAFREVLAKAGDWMKNRYALKHVRHLVSTAVGDTVAKGLRENRLVVTALNVDVHKGNKNWQRVLVVKARGMTAWKKEEGWMKNVALSTGAQVVAGPWGHLAQFVALECVGLATAVPAMCKMTTQFLINFKEHVLDPLRADIDREGEELNQQGEEQQEVLVHVYAPSDRAAPDRDEERLPDQAEEGSTYSSEPGRVRPLQSHLEAQLGPSTPDAFCDTLKSMVVDRLTLLVDAHMLSPAVASAASFTAGHAYRGAEWICQQAWEWSAAATAQQRALTAQALVSLDKMKNSAGVPQTLKGLNKVACQQNKNIVVFDESGALRGSYGSQDSPVSVKVRMSSTGVLEAGAWPRELVLSNQASVLSTPDFVNTKLDLTMNQRSWADVVTNRPSS